MGFRAMLMTDSFSCIEWPAWFQDKWRGAVYFSKMDHSPRPLPGYRGALSTRGEIRDSAILELVQDIARVLAESDVLPALVLTATVNYECGGISLARISANGDVQWYEPMGWQHQDAPTHNHCHGCGPTVETRHGG